MQASKRSASVQEHLGASTSFKPKGEALMNAIIAQFIKDVLEMFGALVLKHLAEMLVEALIARFKRFLRRREP